MKAIMLALLLLLVSSANADYMDEILPVLLARMNDTASKLLPVPIQVLDMVKSQIGNYFFLTDSKNEICRNHSTLLFNAFLDNEIWALKMFDANSKIGSGLMSGKVQDLGDYEQCVSLKVPSGIFQGQHCVVESRGLLPDDLSLLFNPKFPQTISSLRNGFVFSLCVPTSCKPEDVKDHFNAMWKLANISAILYNTSCSSAEIISLKSQDYLMISVLAILCVLVLLSTLYETCVDVIDQDKLLTSFSLCRNVRQLFASDDNPDCIPCLHGLRVIAIAWVMLCHRFIILLLAPNTCANEISGDIDSLWLAPIQEGPVAAEVFFLISGLLMSFNFFKDRLKEIKFNYISYVAKRYIRLTPSLALAVLVYATVILRFSDGPVWTRLMNTYQENCQNNWWTNLLYINNYYNFNELCLPQGWFLAVDFQMHLLGPILLFFLVKNKVLGSFSMLICLISTIIAAIIFASNNKFVAAGTFTWVPLDFGAYMEGYMATQYRAASFLIGMSLGYFIHKIKHENVIIKMNKVILFIGWVLSGAFILIQLYLVTLFVSADHVYDPWFDPIYHVLHKYVVVMVFCWIILVCTLGYGGFVNRFLSWSFLVPQSRLTYCIYLAHYLVQCISTYSSRSAIYFNILTPWRALPEDLLFSNIVAAALYLAVEAPFNNISKRLKSKPIKN